MTKSLDKRIQTAVNLLGTGLKTLVSGVEQILLESDEEDNIKEEPTLRWGFKRNVIYDYLRASIINCDI